PSPVPFSSQSAPLLDQALSSFRLRGSIVDKLMPLVPKNDASPISLQRPSSESVTQDKISFNSPKAAGTVNSSSQGRGGRTDSPRSCRDCWLPRPGGAKVKSSVRLFSAKKQRSFYRSGCCRPRPAADDRASRVTDHERHHYR